MHLLRRWSALAALLVLVVTVIVFKPLPKQVVDELQSDAAPVGVSTQTAEFTAAPVETRPGPPKAGSPAPQGAAFDSSKIEARLTKVELTSGESRAFAMISHDFPEEADLFERYLRLAKDSTEITDEEYDFVENEFHQKLQKFPARTADAVAALLVHTPEGKSSIQMGTTFLGLAASLGLNHPAVGAAAEMKARSLAELPSIGGSEAVMATHAFTVMQAAYGNSHSATERTRTILTAKFPDLAPSFRARAVRSEKN